MSHPVHGKCHKYRMLEKSIFAKAPKEPKPQKSQSEKDADKRERDMKKKYA